MAQDRLVLPAKFPADPEACKPVTAAFFKCLETETALEKRNAPDFQRNLHAACQPFLEKYEACLVTSFKTKRALIRVPESYRPDAK